MIKKIVFDNLKFIIAAPLVFIISRILEINFAIPIFLVVVFFYIKIAGRNVKLRTFNLLNLTLLYVIIFTLGYIIIKKGSPIFYIPFCAIPMLSTLLFNQMEVSILLTLVSGVSLAAVSNNFYYGILFISCGILSSIVIFGSRRRSQVIHTGIIIGLVQALSLFLMDNFKINLFDSYVLALANGIVCSIIVLGVLPIFEYLFKTVTSISLLELADFNHPLLQKMIMEAPGTYHHSLVVGNLSEAACQAVGANALLARIGAYYHDIGKLQKPGYFSENQDIRDNKHNTLSAAMSKLIIMNHVKDGTDLAKKYHLNPRIIDFIMQHHGNSLVYYFYRRALESLEEDQEIREEGFRYPGPKPDSRETAIVLLADSVEAATRALKEPASAKIEEIVRKIINNKFIDGQLDECDITLKDLEKISVVFIRILTGIYHSRINYPESHNGEGNHNKPAKENSHPSEKDKRSSP